MRVRPAEREAVLRITAPVDFHRLPLERSASDRREVLRHDDALQGRAGAERCGERLDRVGKDDFREAGAVVEHPCPDGLEAGVQDDVRERPAIREVAVAVGLVADVDQVGRNGLEGCDLRVHEGLLHPRDAAREHDVAREARTVLERLDPRAGHVGMERDALQRRAAVELVLPQAAPALEHDVRERRAALAEAVAALDGREAGPADEGRDLRLAERLLHGRHAVRHDDVARDGRFAECPGKRACQRGRR